VPPNADATRERLISAAAQLFAERGIDAVSLREINSAAGQRNTTALQYHFGTREGLLRAVIAKHHTGVEIARHALLDQYEAQDRGDLRVLSAALVRPAAAKLGDGEDGRAYLRILAQLVNRAELQVSGPAVSDPTDSTYRWRALVGELLPDETVNRLHRRYTALRITYVELARRAESPPGRDDRLFTSHLIDLVTAVLGAPLSDETRRLLDERARTGSKRSTGRAAAIPGA